MRGFDEPTLLSCSSDGFLWHRFVEMMASPLARAGVLADVRGGKHPLPAPLFIGMAIFAGERIGQ